MPPRFCFSFFHQTFRRVPSAPFHGLHRNAGQWRGLSGQAFAGLQTWQVMTRCGLTATQPVVLPSYHMARAEAERAAAECTDPDTVCPVLHARR